MKAFCDTHDLYFVPSVGPGYDDTRIRPWYLTPLSLALAAPPACFVIVGIDRNAGNKKSREGGDYYERMFEAAVSTYPSAVFVTSYNECSWWRSVCTAYVAVSVFFCTVRGRRHTNRTSSAT